MIFLGREFRLISVCFEWSILEIFVMKQHLHLQPQMFMSLDKLKRASQQI